MTSSMDQGYESYETDPEVIFAAPDHIDHEEVESQASNEPELTIADTESLIGDSIDVEEMGDTSVLKEETRRGFTYGGLFWDEKWEDDMDLYDDLDDWCCAGENYQGKTLRKAWMKARIAAVLVGTRVGRLYSMKDEFMSNYF